MIQQNNKLSPVAGETVTSVSRFFKNSVVQIHIFRFGDSRECKGYL